MTTSSRSMVHLTRRGHHGGGLEERRPSTRRTLRHPAIAFDLRLTDEPVSADLDCEQLPSVDLSPKGVVGDAELPTRLVKRHQFHKR